MDDEVFDKIIEDLKSIRDQDWGSYYMNLFLQNSYPGLSQQEAMERLRRRELGE